MNKKPNNDCIQNNVSEFRKKHKVTQQELADAVGVSRQTIISLEKQDYTPSVMLALKISKFFKTCVNEIFCCVKESEIKI